MYRDASFSYIGYTAFALHKKFCLFLYPVLIVEKGEKWLIKKDAAK